MIEDLGLIESETDFLLDSACRSFVGMEDELDLTGVYWHLVLLRIAGLVRITPNASGID